MPRNINEGIILTIADFLKETMPTPRDQYYGSESTSEAFIELISGCEIEELERYIAILKG